MKNLSTIKTCYIQRIDDEHANAREAWISMCFPESLSDEQVQELEFKSSLEKETLFFRLEDSFVWL